MPSIFYDLNGIRELDVMSALNSMYDLLQLHRRAVGAVEELEVEQLKVSSDLHCQQLTSSKLKVWLIFVAGKKTSKIVFFKVICQQIHMMLLKQRATE